MLKEQQLGPLLCSLGRSGSVRDHHPRPYRPRHRPQAHTVGAVDLRRFHHANEGSREADLNGSGGERVRVGLCRGVSHDGPEPELKLEVFIFLW